jgi:alkanesulfonate monooxygenase SsuD/methylene tetrahydromethanopterin reductase-like flavin-dependent oxidoreductase (luciferase family)
VTNRNGIKFACYIYQQGLEYTDIRRTVLECERLGFDSVWLKDNFTSSWLNAYFSNKEDDEQQPNSENPILECWTTLSSLATLTNRIRLGAILVNIHRIPSVTAKMLSTLDVISNGRIEFGLSAGWYENEIKSYGLPFPKASTRIEMLEESIIIIKKILTENQASFEGKHYTIKDAKCSPKPIQKPYPPIWVGGGGKKTLQLVAKYADSWNYGLCTYDEYLSKISILRDCCKAVGRDYEKIAKAWQAIMLLGHNDSEIKMLKNTKDSDHTSSYSGSIQKKNSNMAIIGTPNDIIKEIKRYIVVSGVKYFTIHFPDLPNLRSLNLFAKSVIPHFRNGQLK